MAVQQTKSPIDDEIIVERELQNQNDISKLIDRAQKGYSDWKSSSLETRQATINQFCELLRANKEELALDITRQMGRPITQSPGEINGALERTEAMLELSDSALQDDIIQDTKTGYQAMSHVPVGVVAVIAPWNYPYLTAINTIIPALLAGNSLILKHSAQTPLVGESIITLLHEAGVPETVCQYLHTDHDGVAALVADSRVNYAAFTGSVEGGRAVKCAQANNFAKLALELGGKDGAYVREDADIDHSVENLVDGAFFNSGQSCCGIERIYVQESIFDEFVEKYVHLVKQYRLGNPLETSTTLGPVVRASSALFIEQQITAAVDKGAKAHLSASDFEAASQGTAYLAPQVLTLVNHSMSIMTDETFGPVIGIMPVKDDQEAIQLLNDSAFGLTASIWTSDKERASAIAPSIETGTVFMNRCDYLNPYLAWVGVKDSGVGVSLSKYGFHQVTRPQSYNFSY